MAASFLHEVGTGEKFWPQLENPGDRLCFPNDEEKIISLLKQLFWKQNKYAFNNAKYPKNNESRYPFRSSVRCGREDEQEEKQNMMSEPPPNEHQSTSNYGAICETKDDTIQGDGPHTTQRAPSQSSLEVLLGGTDRALKRPKISNGKSSISSDFRSRVVAKTQHPAMKTTRGEEETQSKKYALHYPQNQSTTPPSLLTPLVASKEISPSASPFPHSITRTALPASAPIPIPFYVVQHIDGITRRTFWEAGRFGTKFLDEFVGGLANELRCQPEDITMVKLVLRLGSLEIDTEVESGREDVWEMMKGTFKDEIRRAKVRGIGLGAVNVLVWPVMMGKGGWQWGGNGEEDEFEL
ncbi:hypothetical protein VE03_10669 [Pseudogymnoascus sp. 23342-1-I1]|nr:hypothetical protein VE03_10669 [Pseudogymnoascus sp. 23342-1-I1]